MHRESFFSFAELYVESSLKKRNVLLNFVDVKRSLLCTAEEIHAFTLSLVFSQFELLSRATFGFSTRRKISKARKLEARKGKKKNE